ncbi:MAG: SprT-like domain-containing protein [Actinomycetaceae bacterium]|nr:SprT-like domain-containing protein [Actinomycetaceae bacterium]
MDLQEAEKMALSLMDRYELDSWSFSFDRAKRRYGKTNFTDEIISLSAPLTLLNEKSQVRQTVLHEIAHALVGPGHHHDDVWKAQAMRMGVEPRSCSEGVSVPGKYIGICPHGHEIERHRRPKGKYSCSLCSSAYDPQYAITWYERSRMDAV